MGDCTESCSSRAVESYSPGSKSRRQLREKAEAYHGVLRRLRELGVEEAGGTHFEDDLWDHFSRLPYSYALDMSVEKAEDVLMHKRLLLMAKNPATRPAIEVRPVQDSSSNQNGGNSVHSDTVCGVDAQASSPRIRHSPTHNLGMQPITENALEGPDLHTSDGSTDSGSLYSGPMYEITISTNDKRKFLSQLTSLMSGLGLNIHEAHAFSTEDGYSLDVFVVACSNDLGPKELKTNLAQEIKKTERSLSSEKHVAGPSKQEKNGPALLPKHLNNKGEDIWEIDSSMLSFEKKLASGSYGDLYKGTYYSQDVAIKLFRTEQLNKALQQEFTQEVFILRKIRHKNIVQFIGASTRPPRLCIVTEYMPGGSVFDFLHKQKDVLKLSTVLRFAIDVSKGMSFLHQNNIIHRDLKAANLLMDENEVIKIADFGVAKIQTQPGVMTAETGTYRWMAPEVIEHKPYNHKADIFSFGIVLWELLTGKLPYEELTPLQAAIGVVHKGMRPTIPSYTHPALEKLLNRCWQRDPSMRPEFSEILEILNHIATVAQG